MFYGIILGIPADRSNQLISIRSRSSLTAWNLRVHAPSSIKSKSGPMAPETRCSWRGITLLQ